MASLVHVFVISIQRHITNFELHGKANLGVKLRFTIALVVCGLLIVKSHTNCDVSHVTRCPVMRHYENADRDKQWHKTSKTQVFLPFFKHGDHGTIEIAHLYDLCCRGWYCYPAQHSLNRPQAVTRQLAHLVAVPDNSTNHNSADRIMVNSLKNAH